MRARTLVVCLLAPLAGGTLAVLSHDAPPPAAPPAAAPAAGTDRPAAEPADVRTAEAPTAAARPLADVAPVSGPTDALQVWEHGVSWLDEEMPHEAVGVHYRVRTDVSAATARQVLDVLEPLHPRFVERFGGDAVAPTPDGRLPVFVYTSDAVHDDSPFAFGRKWPETDRGRTRVGYYDRLGNAHVLHGPAQERAVVHEAAHQFQALATAGRGRDLRPFWWVEGVAHDLELDLTGAPPTDAEWKRLNRAAFRYLHRRPDWTDALLGLPLPGAESEGERRGVGFLLVRFLRHAEGGRYADWFRRFERVRAGGGLVQSSPGLEEGARLHEALLSFARGMRDVIRVTTIRYRAGERTGEQVRTRIGSESFADLGPGPGLGETTVVRCTLEGPLHSGDALGVGIDGRGDGAEIIVRLDHHAEAVTVERRSGGSAASRTLPSAGVKVRTGGDRYAFSISGDGAVRVRRNAMTIGEDALELGPDRGTLALFVRAGDLRDDHATFRFDDVAIETGRTAP